ncbi:MAG: hypothetical protein LHW56_10200 [Candidatus Cloacimonetes bacterium]|jgi:hypothetical protein|nr:hypothetical protein [Candidatus Cloacimonadota bacterium]MDY0173263.1 hypothetical protein [Candidatus Cloacimonadaceae bacterium]
MTEEIMPREDRMGKILAFVSGCIAGITSVFAVALLSEISSDKRSEDDDNLPADPDEEGILK